MSLRFIDHGTSFPYLLFRMGIILFCLLIVSRVMSQTNESFTIETESLLLTLTRGGITGLVNRLTGESYVDSSAVNDVVGLLHTGSYSLLAGNLTDLKTIQRGDTTQVLFISAQSDSFSTFFVRDAIADQVLVWQEGSLAHHRGVYGARVGVASFNLFSGRLIVPLMGGVAIDQSSALVEQSWDYLTNWQAQMLVFEGVTGSVGFWYEDSLFAPKRLTLQHHGDQLKLLLEVHNQGDFDQRTAIHTPVLHIKAFAGDWRQPAGLYRSWMLDHLHARRLTEKPAWVDSIGCQVIARTLDRSMLDSLVNALVPRHTLLYVPDWRLAGYDVNYPNYTPRPETVGFIQYAQQLGFRVMLHVNPFGIAPYNPLYQEFKAFQLRDPFTGQLSGWRWDTDQLVRHAFINPASVELQDMFLGCMQEVINELHPDAIHLDVDFCAWNSDNAVLNGENPAMGNRTFHRRLAEAFPNIVWGGENLTEVNSYRDTFAQRWKTDVLNWMPHPISTFLFCQTTMPVGYLGFENPDEYPDLYVAFMLCYERWGVLPTLSLRSPGDLRGPQTQDIIRIANAWSRHGLRPDFDSDWGEATEFRFIGRDGERAEYRRTDFGSTFVVQGDSLYNRVTGVNRVKTHHSIRGWFAYNQKEIFGLNPGNVYWLRDSTVAMHSPHLHELSKNAIVDNICVTESGGHLSLSSLSTSCVIDLVDLLPKAQLAIRRHGEVQEIGDGAFVSAAMITLAGIPKKGLETHPPYLHEPGDVIFTYSVSLPDSPQIYLDFYAGLDEGAQDSDGLDFFVEVNGQRIFTELVREKAWRKFQVDLSDWRGQDVLLTLGNDPGPPGSTTYWDWGRWGEVVILMAGETPFTAQLFVPANIDIHGARVTEKFQNFYTIRGSLPAEVIYAVKGDPVSLPHDILANFSGHTGVNRNGLYFGDERPWGAGQIRPVSCGGVVKTAISGHPPLSGRTVIHQSLTLPNIKSLKLCGSYGIADGAQTSGIYFIIKVNGEEKRNQFALDTKWTDFEIDLSDYAGQSVLLELITEPGINNYWDWANWADLVVRPGLVGAVSDGRALPESFDLSRPYPNPFNDAVELTLTVPEKGQGVMAIYNIRGQKVFAKKILLNGPGIITLHWDGVDGKNQPLSSGLYFFHIRFAQKQWIRKALLLK